jgi:hypothetical protein
MQVAWIQWSGAASAVALALLVGTPLRAADDNGVRPVAEELGQRTKPAANASGDQKGGLSDSAVRVLMTYAFSIIPDEAPGADGKAVKVDKTDPNKFLIPTEDARRVIRVATRSAYAEVCDLRDLERANYQTLMKGEAAKKIWTHEQLLAINALHMFAVSYFTGDIKITTKEEADPADPAAQAAPADPAAQAAPAVPAAEGAPTVVPKAPQAKPADEAAAGTDVVAPKRPECSPEQKVKVTNSINAYVQAAKAEVPGPPQAPKTPPVQAAQPTPSASGAN